MSRGFYHRTLFAGLLLALTGAAEDARAQATDDEAAKLAAAQVLYEDATKAMDAQDYATACPKLEEIVKLAPQGVGARLTLAQCYEGAGKLASAYTNYLLAEKMAADANQSERQSAAHERVEALRPNLAMLTIVVAENVRAFPGLEVQRDGAQLDPSQWGVALAVNKGRHTIVATVPGKRPWERTIEVIADGAVVVTTIDAMVDEVVAPTAPPAPSSKTLPVIVQQPARRPDAPSKLPPSLSHRGEFGALFRADLDGQGSGFAPVFGFSYGIGDYVEISASMLLGHSKGVEPGVTFILAREDWKPILSLGTPIFFVDGAYPGMHAAAGLEWDPCRYFGVFVQAGVSLFPSVPVGYDKVVFVPSIGIQPRL